MTDTPKDEQKKSLVDLFTKDELKTFFLRYLLVLGGIEVVIFLAAFFSILEPYPSPFPWREYFYAAFTIPLGITFMLGIVIIAFNTYYFKDTGHFDGLKSSLDEDESGAFQKRKMFLNLSWQFQFLLFLLLLGFCALIMFHLNDILALMGNAGEKALNAVLIFAGILLTAVVLLGFLFLWFHYKLRKKKMEDAHQYKCELMSQAGMLLLDDNTVIDSQGNVIHQPGQPHGTAESAKAIEARDVSLLPRVSGRNRDPD